MLTATPLLASSFKVHPLRFEFSEKSRTAIFKLNNTTDHAVTVQLSSVSWTQSPEGADVYEKTTDIVFFPRIVKIEQGEERIVRLGYRGAPALRREKTYRLFAQELPPRGQKDGTLNFAFRFSLPIFIRADKAPKPVEKLLGSELVDGRLLVWMTNEGGRHYSVKKFDTRGYNKSSEVTFEGDTGGWYVLAKSRRQFAIPIDETACALSSEIELDVDLGSKRLRTRVPVLPGQCKKPVEKNKQLAVQ